MTTEHNQAVQDLIDNIQQRKVKEAQMRALQATIDRAHQAVGEVNATNMVVGELKRKRRGLLASIFLGREEASTDTLDAEIQEAEMKHQGLKPKAEGAQAAIEELHAELDPMRSKAIELAQQDNDLRYQALLSLAREKETAYANAVEAFENAYADMLGAFKAAEQLADPSAGRLHVVSVFSQTRIELPVPSVMQPGDVLKGLGFVRDVAGKVTGYEQAARNRIDSICQQVEV
ncbi:MAG TPA: hypothetical protein VGK09_10695 [Rhodocyclaceae bacterium]|jgi:seryl-tRNA synthetase